MTDPTPKPTSTPAVAAALGILAGFWAFAALLLGLNLWQEPDSAYGADTGLSVNAGAVTVVVLCLLGASLCGVGAAVVSQLVKAQTVGVERG